MRKVPKTRALFNSMLDKKVSPQFASRIVPLAMPAIGMHDGILGDEPPQLGTSRFGGRPDLPESTVWPMGPQGPLAFLGQLSLADITPLDIDKVLPHDGMLAFFFNIRDYAWGFRPEDSQRFAVLYIPAEAKLCRRDFPATIVLNNRVDRVRQVVPYLRWELPEADPLARQMAGFLDEGTVGKPATDPFTIKYWNVAFNLTHDHAPIGTHQLLGWANGIYQQSEDCRLKCAIAELSFPASATPEYAKAIENRHHWRCLLQIRDDYELYNDNWADGGTIAFMIRDDHLAKRRFDSCWCILSSS